MIKIKDQKWRFYLVACNRNQWSALHTLHAYRTSFHVAFHVISCCISHHFMSYFIHFITHITHITHIISSHVIACHRIFHILESWITPHCMSFYLSFYVISSWKFISCSFIPFRNEESRNRVKTAHSSIGRHLSGAFYSKDKSATWVRRFYKR